MMRIRRQTRRQREVCPSDVSPLASVLFRLYSFLNICFVPSCWGHFCAKRHLATNVSQRNQPPFKKKTRKKKNKGHDHNLKTNMTNMA